MRSCSFANLRRRAMMGDHGSEYDSERCSVGGVAHVACDVDLSAGAAIGNGVTGPADGEARFPGGRSFRDVFLLARGRVRADRKSTRLNSSHLGISSAVFCL